MGQNNASIAVLKARLYAISQTFLPLIVCFSCLIKYGKGYAAVCIEYYTHAFDPTKKHNVTLLSLAYACAFKHNTLELTEILAFMLGFCRRSLLLLFLGLLLPRI